MNQVDLEIITPQKAAYKGQVLAVTVPGTLGSFQILFNHAPLISTMEIGIIKIKLSEAKTEYYSTSGGTVEVLDNKILILADSLEFAEEIDIERAKRAMQRARERLENKSEKIDTARAEAALARAVNRLQVAEKYFTRV
ncbi:MAG: F0F1 ATP synthase subunit epsilon [Ignavibacteria bacterium]